MKEIRVTIGLPFYNDRATLLTALRSVFAQSSPDWELLLVDDGSTDGSLEIARAVRDPRVRLIHDGVNRGLAARLNQIASLASGRYVGRMDADDIMHPRRIEMQARFLDQNPEVSVTAGQAFIIDESEQLIGKAIVPQPARFYDVLKAPPIVHPTMMARLEWLCRNRYSEEFPRAEDHEMWCRTYPWQGEIVTLPECIYFHRARFSWRSYLTTYASELRLLRRYGPGRIGWPATVALSGSVFARAALWSIAIPSRVSSMVMQTKVMSMRKFERLTAADVEAAKDALARVHGTCVPGISSGAENTEASFGHSMRAQK